MTSYHDIMVNGSLSWRRRPRPSAKQEAPWLRPPSGGA